MTTAYIDPVLVACLTKAEQKLGKSDWQPNWAKPGVRARYGLRAPDGSEHPAVEMTKGFAVHVNNAGVEIAEPETTSAEVSVLMCVSTDLDAGLAALRRPRSPSPDAFKGLTFPMIDLDQSVDVGWLRGRPTARPRAAARRRRHSRPTHASPRSRLRGPRAHGRRHRRRVPPPSAVRAVDAAVK